MAVYSPMPNMNSPSLGLGLFSAHLQGNHRRRLLKEMEKAYHSGSPTFGRIRLCSPAFASPSLSVHLSAHSPSSPHLYRLIAVSHRLLRPLSVVAGCVRQRLRIAENLAEVKPPGFLQLDACSEASVPPVQRSVARFPQLLQAGN